MPQLPARTRSCLQLWLRARQVALAHLTEHLYPHKPRVQPGILRAHRVTLEDSAWRRLWANKDDRSMRAVCGVTVGAFQRLLPLFQMHYRAVTGHPGARPIAKTRKRGRPWSHEAYDALGLVLQWLHTTMTYQTLQQLCGLSYGCVARMRRRGLRALVAALKELPEALVEWPTLEKMRFYAQVMREKHGPMPGGDIWGVFDGVKIPIYTPNKDGEQQTYWNGWVHGHYISNLLMFAPDGTIVHYDINHPGCYHDSRIALYVPHGALMPCRSGLLSHLPGQLPDAHAAARSACDLCAQCVVPKVQGVGVSP